MLFYFDESGDFGFPLDRFDSYTQAGVICPESETATVDNYLQDRCHRWGLDELHATHLSPGGRIHVCRFIAASNLQLVAQGTDSEMVDAWEDAQPPHPFIANFERPSGWWGSRRRRVEEDVIDISAIFENGLNFVPSHDSAGLQLADVVANVVRRAVVEPNDWQAQLAYEFLRPKLRGRDGTALSLFSLPGAGQPPGSVTPI